MMTQAPDIKPGNYYVSCRLDDGRTVCLAGPFRDDHAAALALVDRAAIEADKLDPRAPWYSYGTLRTDYTYDRPGLLNQALGLPVTRQLERKETTDV